MQSRPGTLVRVVSMSTSEAPKALAEELSAIGMMSRPLHDKERDAIARKHGKPHERLVRASFEQRHQFELGRIERHLRATR